LQLTASPSERDLILGDIAGYFISMGRHEAARDALMIVDATSTSELARIAARGNMVVNAARAGDEIAFRNARARMEGVELPTEFEVNYLIESARGLRRFGEAIAARELLERARDLASAHDMNRAVFEAEALLSAGDVAHETVSGETRYSDSDSAAEVEQELRRMASSVA
jgi:hypothetical protein